MNLILGDVPTGYSAHPYRSLLLRIRQPYLLTWRDVFSLLNIMTGFPVNLFTIKANKRFIRFKEINSITPFKVENHRMHFQDGRVSNDIYIQVSLNRNYKP